MCVQVIDDGPKLIWDSSDGISEKASNGLAYLPAPKVKLPSHEDSYNPPFEYRGDLSEEDGASDRQFYDALRRVPAYSPFVVERYVSRSLKQT